MSYFISSTIYTAEHPKADHPAAADLQVPDPTPEAGETIIASFLFPHSLDKLQIHGGMPPSNEEAA